MFPPLCRYLTQRELRCPLNHGTKLRHLSTALSVCFRLRKIYAEYFRKILDDVRGKDSGWGFQPHRIQFFLKWLAPVHECLDTHPGTISQLLFCHCFHICDNAYWLMVIGYWGADAMLLRVLIKSHRRHGWKRLIILFRLTGDGSRLAGLLGTKKACKPNGHRGKQIFTDKPFGMLSLKVPQK